VAAAAAAESLAPSNKKPRPDKGAFDHHLDVISSKQKAAGPAPPVSDADIDYEPRQYCNHSKVHLKMMMVT